jgi:hypothetical protein
LQWRLFLASKIRGFESHLSSASCHGGLFWRVILAGCFDGSFWRVIPAHLFGGFSWQINSANIQWVQKKAKQRKEE